MVETMIRRIMHALFREIAPLASFNAVSNLGVMSGRGFWQDARGRDFTQLLVDEIRDIGFFGEPGSGCRS
jgi:hypothetical protein